MALGRVISLNDEVVEIPKIRKDQQRRIQNIVRDNAKNPLIVIGLVRDYVKHMDNFVTVQHNKTENYIQVIFKNQHSKMQTEYTFKLSAPIILEAPTLD